MELSSLSVDAAGEETLLPSDDVKAGRVRESTALDTTRSQPLAGAGRHY
jgi:hypothetical protein